MGNGGRGRREMKKIYRKVATHARRVNGRLVVNRRALCLFRILRSPAREKGES